MLQALSSIQYICFRKTSGSNMGAPNLLLAPDAIEPRYDPGCKGCAKFDGFWYVCFNLRLLSFPHSPMPQFRFWRSKAYGIW